MGKIHFKTTINVKSLPSLAFKGLALASQTQQSLIEAKNLIYKEPTFLLRTQPNFMQTQPYFLKASFT